MSLLFPVSRQYERGRVTTVKERYTFRLSVLVPVIGLLNLKFLSINVYYRRLLFIPVMPHFNG